jgi:hypothetical protein
MYQNLRKRVKGHTMGCTYVKEFSFGGKVTPAAAVHKHEKALHPDKPMTKMAKGGKVMEKATGETYPSRKAMMMHEKEETPRMQREEIMQKSSMRAPRRSVPVAPMAPMIAMNKGGMHKMPDGKMMKNSAMKKGGMANSNC